MDKIIKLLIEYDGGDYVKNGLSISEKIRFEDYESLTYYKDMTYEIISKGYRFIEWLVENDKIDRPKVWLKIKDLGEEYGWFGIYSGIHVECLIMLLAISDTPINDLISYLK